jgi:hypothetical protein
MCLVSFSYTSLPHSFFFFFLIRNGGFANLLYGDGQEMGKHFSWDIILSFFLAK